MRVWLAKHMRLWADRMDPYGAPRAVGWSFTFEHGRGLVFNDKLRGCPVWYLGKDDHERAYSEGSAYGRAEG